MFTEHFATQCHAAQGYLSLGRYYEFLFIHSYFIYLVSFSQNKNLMITEFVLCNQDEKANIYSILTGFEI